MSEGKTIGETSGDWPAFFCRALKNHLGTLAFTPSARRSKSFEQNSGTTCLALNPDQPGYSNGNRLIEQTVAKVKIKRQETIAVVPVRGRMAWTQMVVEAMVRSRYLGCFGK